MEIMQVLHMNKGEGETSYAKNSELQRSIISLGNSMIKEALVKLLCQNFPKSLGIADLGCSSGPNTLIVVSDIIVFIHATSHQLGHPLPELRVFLNDLPSNDFNDVFVSLPTFYEKLEQEKGISSSQCFVSGVPGSFYGRRFPENNLHFVHSSSSLHWLSQVPPALNVEASVPLNKGKIYISKTSPIEVLEAYKGQFQSDFSLFLRSRSEEMVDGGRMILSFMSRRNSCPFSGGSWYMWELVSNALMSMALDGLVEEEKIDSFNAPYYAPCPDELTTEIRKEGSFTVDEIECFEVDWEGGAGTAQDDQKKHTKNDEDKLSGGQRVAKVIRAVLESMLECHFGKEIMDELFKRYGQLIDDHLSSAETRSKNINLVISLLKKE